MICTLEFIPDHCRVAQVLERNGKKCTSCWKWKDSCRDQSNKIKDVLPPESNCPNLTCTGNIPQTCAQIETYEYMGKICEKCPVHRTGCVPDLMPSQGDTQCPVKPCTLQLIPDECREIPTFQHEGLTCKGCPRWRQGCKITPSDKGSLKDSLVPIVSCPLLVCDSYVPKDCQVKREFQHRGRTCTHCPSWKEGCREQERLNVLNFAGGNRFGGTEVPCPKFPCIDYNIPAECKIDQPFEFRGRTCYKCPVRSPACATSFPGRNTPKLPTCPLMKCERRADIPSSCYQREFFNFRGNVCEKCPSVIPECLLVPPRPNIQITPEIIGRVETPEKSCPLLKCEMMTIPQECIETPVYPHEGKMCQGCPRPREGCMPSPSGQFVSNSNREFPIIPARKPDTNCPIKACPMIYIPPECKEDQPYQYQGKTCYDCPKQKKSCITINSQSSQQPGNLQQMSCPMFGCPYILIPPECRVERPFQYQGKTCYMCPQWREGCVPLPPKPNINYPTAGPLTTTEKTVLEPSGQNKPETSCPLVPCTKILIPPECREEQPYDYNGKVCYKCPKWKDGCLGRGNQAESTTIPNTSIDTTKLLKPNNSPSIRDLKEIIPVSDIINTVNAANCPPLRCPAMFIPITCRQESMYQYQGRTCQGCPTWRLGCNPMSGTPMNMNANGILSFNLFNELFAFNRR
ncbi:uncharacterized protein LOC123537124 [Mercenaria mercenaria]|uniref:uncharacterized protein LOC123537124 n=1 Tax=Mercenaria mercenaria TaxID=6596 RepID=UPI00234E91DF|nr:uncharacterized protein LOC123537124 [Mercenaria mercenaria]